MSLVVFLTTTVSTAPLEGKNTSSTTDTHWYFIESVEIRGSVLFSREGAGGGGGGGHWGGGAVWGGGG